MQSQAVEPLPQSGGMGIVPEEPVWKGLTCTHPSPGCPSPGAAPVLLLPTFGNRLLGEDSGCQGGKQFPS